MCDECNGTLIKPYFEIGNFKFCEKCFVKKSLSSMNAFQIGDKSETEKQKILLADAVISASSKGQVTDELRILISQYGGFE